MNKNSAIGNNHHLVATLRTPGYRYEDAGGIFKRQLEANRTVQTKLEFNLVGFEDDREWLNASPSSFDFWDNDLDAEYDAEV